MSDSQFDFKCVCRLCLSKKSLTPIFHDDTDNRRYSTAIFIISGIKVSPNDSLPQNICNKCVTHLNKTLEFRQKCRETEIQLLNSKTSDKKPMDHDYCIDKENKPKIKVEIDFEPNSEDVKVELESDEEPLSNLTRTKKDVELIANNHKEILENFKHFAKYESSRRVSCRICSANLSYRSLDSHMMIRHPGVDERRAKCEYCHRYIIKSKIGRHVKLMHGVNDKEQTAGLKCAYCKEEYNTKEELLEHIDECASKKRKQKINRGSREIVPCDVCNKEMQKASLRMHKAIKHSGLGPVCEHCGKTFGNRFRLNEHCRSKHGYEKFKCSSCDFKSASAMSLRNHERRHRGEKPFICETCGAKFHAAYLLSQHKKSHRTEKLIKCNECPATFKANNSLHMHKITCHSKYFYKCFLCDRLYNCRHYVVKHLRHFHNFKDKVGQLEKIFQDNGNTKLKAHDVNETAILS